MISLQNVQNIPAKIIMLSCILFHNLHVPWSKSEDVLFDSEEIISSVAIFPTGICFVLPPHRHGYVKV
jgi:hypothetical protein